MKEALAVSKNLEWVPFVHFKSAIQETTKYIYVCVCERQSMWDKGMVEMSMEADRRKEDLLGITGKFVLYNLKKR